MNKYSYALYAALIPALASCSGSSTSTSTPTPTNRAPIVELVTSLSSFDEGQTVQLDASGSSDPDGDTLSFTWTQTSGPPAQLRISGSTASYTLPEVDVDTAVAIEVSVSDGQVTRTTSSTLTSENISLTPTINAFGAPETVLSGVTQAQKLAATASRGIGSAPAYWTVTGTGNSGSVTFYDPPVLGNFGTGKETPLTENVSGNVSKAANAFVSRTETDLALGFETEGIVRLFRQDFNDQPASEQSSLNAPGVCGLAPLFSFNVPFLNDIVVGQRGQGLTIFRNNANAGNISEAGQFDTFIELTSMGTFCHIKSVPGFREVYAYNQDDSLIHAWTATGDTTFVKQPDIDLEIPTHLDLIDFEVLGQSGNFQVTAALVTNNQHDGDHRIILQYTPFNGTGTPTRIERIWRKGIPTDLVILNPDTGNTPDIAATLLSAPYIVILENSASITLGDTEPNFSAVQYFETQLGATEISHRWIAYKEKGQVEFDRPLNLN